MSANCYSFWGTSSPYSLSVLYPWTPLGVFRSPDPLGYSSWLKIFAAASGNATASPQNLVTVVKLLMVVSDS